MISGLGLVLIELLCFLPIMRKAGFYFDDWATLCQLYFGPKEFGIWALMQNYAVHNSLVIIRPLEALHFGIAYWFFGVNPWPWHALNIGLEIIVGLLTCAIVSKLSGSQVLGFFSGAFVLLCPSHDSSHYWIVCSSVSLSFALYLGSLLATIQSVTVAKPSSRLLLQTVSAFLFALSLFNYETFMPLAVVNILVVIFSQMNKPFSKSNFAEALKLSVPTILSMVLPVVSLVCYLKFIVPAISAASMREIHFDPQVFLSTIFNGVGLHTPVTFMSFVVQRAAEGLDGATGSEVVRLLLIALLSGGGIYFLSRIEPCSSEAVSQDCNSLLFPEFLILVGIIAVVVSYSIFGLSPDYPPTFMTYLNRINTGASLGTALAIGGLWSYVSGKIPSVGSFRLIRLLLFWVLPTLLLVGFTLANFGLAKPWIVSWQNQKHIQEQIVLKAHQWPADASILLANCPRYVMWAPVYDGVWDFRNTLQIILNRRDLQAGVVSERLVLGPAGLTDVSRGVVCGVYPFSSLYLLVAPSCNPVRVQSADQFVQVVERDGMGFGLDPAALKAWQQKAKSIGSLPHEPER